MKIRYCSAALAYTDVNVLICTNKKSTAWLFPKGGLERGLTPQENAAKECLEETGFACSEKGFSLGTYEILKEGVINRIEVFALSLLDYKNSPEKGREVAIVPAEDAIKMVGPFLAPFVARLYEHLEASREHDSRKTGK
jgi:8-oxo-dGTP pyrophosphatase MutT (NUDIX family)